MYRAYTYYTTNRPLCTTNYRACILSLKKYSLETCYTQMEDHSYGRSKENKERTRDGTEDKPIKVIGAPALA
jgi:hypothetical protein